MPVEGSGRWPEHERSIAPSRPRQAPVLFDVNSPSRSGSKVKPAECSGQWLSNFAHVPRPGPYPALHFAAPLSHYPERQDLRIFGSGFEIVERDPLVGHAALFQHCSRRSEHRWRAANVKVTSQEIEALAQPGLLGSFMNQTGRDP